MTEGTEVPIALCSSLAVAGWWHRCLTAVLALSRSCVRALRLEMGTFGERRTPFVVILV